MTYSIVYVSTATQLFSAAQLDGILQESRSNNAANGITGVLLYCNGSIIQVLEGEEEQVRATFNRITKDGRHFQVIKIFSGKTDQRSFHTWSMGYRSVTTQEMDELKKVLPFINNPYTQAPTGNVLTLLHNFYVNNHRN